MLRFFIAFSEIFTKSSLSTVTTPTDSTNGTNLVSKNYTETIINFFSLFYVFASWAKARVIYYVNNWIYTTNHKRIAVNYLWFVIFSGVCGMVLATIIRLEMAYPGVGILAGDSLQYLSVVTAHAVIMVFFMIMPLLFGAFGNFLLPTQLGVHDVAFPRLNSVAFWFLPGGLIMLCQLVCLDRRYQRMNCFNIREIQTLLKARFYADLLNESSRHLFLSRTTLGLRFKLQDLNFLNLSSLLSSRYGVFNSFMARTQTYNLEPTENFTSSATHANLLTVLPSKELFLNNTWFSATYFLILERLLSTPLLSFIQTPSYPEVLGIKTSEALTTAVREYFTIQNVKDYVNNDRFSLVNLPYTYPTQLPTFSINNFCNDVFSKQNGFTSYFERITTDLTLFLGTVISKNYWTSYVSNLVLITPLYSSLPWYAAENLTIGFQKSKLAYTSGTFSLEDVQSKSTFSFHEDTSNYRFQRLQNPVFKYDFKLGNYMPDENKRKSPFLFTTIHDLTTGVRKASWSQSPDFSKFLKSDIASYFLFFTTLQNTSNLTKSFNNLIGETLSSHTEQDPFYVNLSHSAGFYNVLFSLSSSESYTNYRWLAISALDQKLYRMFLTNSMQQRIHSNWRQLKFTREGWRCKLLAARHQNTLHRRYINEDSTVWSVERNAKDVLPGWAMVTPFSARTRFTAIGKVDLGLFGVFLVLNSSIVASSNFLITYRYLSTLNNRKMRDARSFFTEGVMVASWMMIAANPMLAIGILMLLSDRHWQTSFFDYSGGGDTVMFQHMFWFFGHPEVYVIMIPTFGFNNTILSFYLRKRVSARASLLYSMYTIAFLGFFVWGHHMYMVGLAHTTRMLFSTLTVMISVPAATKLMHWCVTLVNSTFVIELPFLFQLLFIFFFVSGGISGMAVAHTGMDILFHDSFYVVGHFHVMLAGAGMFGSFGAFYFYFPAIWGVKFSRIWGYLHLLYYLLGQLMTVIPMMWLGYSGMPRRVLDYPASMGGWHAVTSAGHLLSVGGMFAFFIMLFDSMRQGRAATRNGFGLSRFNTRLNFYLYIGARTWFLQRKGWYVSRFNQHASVKLNSTYYTNYEYLETTLFSYSFLKTPKTRG